MPIISRATNEISCKIVYCGPAGSGKSSNLRYILAELPPERRGEGSSVEPTEERPLFFEYLPLELGTIAGFRTRLHLYAAPGPAFFAATRRHVLQAVDGVVFVADSRNGYLSDNVSALRQMHIVLAGDDVDPAGVPMVFQYNKRDLADDELLPLDELDDALNFRSAPAFPASATSGAGVFQTLRGAAELVLRHAVRRA
jgi:mutual gliding-motility protein MglA